MPVGHGKTHLGSANPAVDALLGGWQISTVNTMQGGTPYNLTYGPNSANAVSPQISATYRGANEYRPNVVAGQPYRLCNSGHTCLSQRNAANGTIDYLNLAALTLPATKDANGNLLSPFGNLARNSVRTPLYYQTDLDLNKRFSTPVERMKIEFRAEAYNVFNHTNLYFPGSSTSELGAASGTNAIASPTAHAAAVSSTFEPRILQFGLKIVY